MGDGAVQALGISGLVSLAKCQVILENLVFVTAKPEGLDKVDVRLRPLQEGFILEPLDVGQITQGGEPKNIRAISVS